MMKSTWLDIPSCFDIIAINHELYEGEVHFPWVKNLSGCFETTVSDNSDCAEGMFQGVLLRFYWHKKIRSSLFVMPTKQSPFDSDQHESAWSLEFGVLQWVFHLNKSYWPFVLSKKFITDLHQTLFSELLLFLSFFPNQTSSLLSNNIPLVFMPFYIEFFFLTKILALLKPISFFFFSVLSLDGAKNAQISCLPRFIMPFIGK